MAADNKELNKGSEPVEIKSYTISQDLHDALSLSSEGLPPGKLLGVEDLLLGILREGERGSDLVSVLADWKTNTLKKYLEERSLLRTLGENVPKLDEVKIKTSNAVQELFIEAEQLAEGTIFSDHIVLAELARGEESLLAKAFEDIGASHPRLDIALAISDRIVYKEKGKRKTDIGSILVQPAQTSEPVVDGSAKERKLPVVEKAKPLEIVRPEWISELIDATENNPVTVVVSETLEEVESAIHNLSSVLNNGEVLTLKYKDFFQLNPDAFSATELNNFFLERTGKVIYIPNFEAVRDNKQLRQLLQTGRIRVVTQMEETALNRLVAQDRLLRSAKKVVLEPPTAKEAKRILDQNKHNLEESISTASYRIKIADSAIEEAVDLAAKYYKGLSLLAASRALIMRAATNKKIKKSGLGLLKDVKVSKGDGISSLDIETALYQLVGVEVGSEDPERRYLDLEDRLKRRVIGQDEAIEAVSEAVRRARAGLKDPDKPVGTFIFMGPSGVGKTQLAKTLAEVLFDDRSALITLDMSEYRESNNVARMIGSPPGYVDSDKGGQLTEAVSRRPSSVILFDEIEKAHPQVTDVLLQVFDEGRLTDGQGKTHDFKNTILIMTGNVGSEYFRVEEEVGREKVVEAVMEEIKDPEKFRTEFLNRVDAIIVFNSLSKEDLLKIADLQIGDINERLEDKKISIKVSEAAKAYLVETSYSKENGARPLERLIDRLVLGPLSDKILSGDVQKGAPILVDVAKGKIVLTKQV